jgi:hypothetical protein
MSSPTGGIPVGAQQAIDLLHKLITESTKVQAMYFNPASGVRASVWGIARLSGDGLVHVLEREHESDTPSIGFDPSLAVLCRYGDGRVLQTPDAAGFFKQHFSSALTFTFADGAILALFEFAAQG